MEILREYPETIGRLVSEPDTGISDALNKGLGLAGGTFIQFLHAGDSLPDDAVAVAVKVLQSHPAAAFVFGDIEYGEMRHRNPNSVVKGDPMYGKSIRYVMPRLNHPTILARRELFTRYGGFDTSLQVAMDYDWLLRIHNGGETGVYDERIRIAMQPGGVSDRRPFLAFTECRDISIQHGFNPLVAYAYFVMRCMKQILFVGLRLRR